MGLFETVVRALLYLCFIVLCFYLCIYVLGALGIIIPPVIEKILMLMLALVALLILARLFYPFFSGGSWFGPGPGPGGPGGRF